MTYNVNDPLATDKIRNWPSSVTTNEWPRLKTIIEGDHQFNLSAATNDGYHKVVHSILQGSHPAGLGNILQTYNYSFNSDTYLFGVTGSGKKYMLSFPIRAAGLFNGANGAILGVALNMAAATRTAVGKFTVNFDFTGTNTTAFAASNYIYMLSVERPTVGSADVSTIECVARNNTTMLVECRQRTGGSNEYYDPVSFTAVILGVA